MSAGTIVCVDDRRDVLAALMRDLEDFYDDYALLACESASEAHQLLEDLWKTGDRLSLLITDQQMPGGTGSELVGRLKADARFGALPKLVLTGDISAAQTALAASMDEEPKRHQVLPKPWQRDQLHETVRHLLSLTGQPSALSRSCPPAP